MKASRREILLFTGAALAPMNLAWAQGGSAADAQFAKVSQRWIAEACRLNPVFSTQLGEHRYDADLDDIGPVGRAARLKLAKDTLAALAAIPKAQLSKANQVDLAILSNQVRQDIWSEEVLQDWSWDPLLYNGLAGGALYGLTARDFAPLPVRLKSATARMEKLPKLLEQARGNLDPARTPKIHAETVSSQNKGLHSLVDGLVADARALPDADRVKLEAAARTAKAAIDTQQAWIDKTLVPGAKGEFRLGEKLYDQKLAFALNSPLTRAEIHERALAAMTKTRAEMYEIARGVVGGKPGAPPTPAKPTEAEQQAVIEAALELAYAETPPRNKLVEEAEKTLVQATAFVRAKDLVTVPTEPVKIGLVPEFQRGVAVAYCDPAGPLERGQSTFYKISPIPDGWTDAQATSFLREYNTRGIQEVTIHEAMPGHYLQLAHGNRYPSILRAVLFSGPFVEGWACYAQDIMADAGYLDRDPLYLLVHLKLVLRAIANAILDQGVHVTGMSRDDAMKLMTVQAFQQEREAAGKWVRAQLSSAQLPTYFVGWQEHWALRQEAERRAGAGFNAKRYHDQALSYGSPPVRFVRQLMFDEAIA